MCQRFEQSCTSGDVVVKVPARSFHGLTGRLISGEMHHGIDVVVPDHLRYRLSVGDVSPYERSVTEGGRVAELHGVHYDDIPTPFSQKPDRVRADVTGATSDQDAHA